MKKSDKAFQNDRILERLAMLYVEAQPYLGHYAWPLEEERWDEMIVCAIVSAGSTPELARLSLQFLKHVQLDTPTALVELSDQSLATTKEVFSRSGMSEDEVDRSIAALQMTAAVCLKRWGGRTQVFLRRAADSAAKELTHELASEGMSSTAAHTLAVLWLQNVLNAPLLSVSSEAVKAFCVSEGVTHQQLMDAADHLGLNVAVLDEVLTLHHPSHSKSNVTSEHVGKTSAIRQSALRGSKARRRK